MQFLLAFIAGFLAAVCIRHFKDRVEPHLQGPRPTELLPESPKQMSAALHGLTRPRHIKLTLGDGPTSYIMFDCSHLNSHTHTPARRPPRAH